MSKNIYNHNTEDLGRSIFSSRPVRASRLDKLVMISLISLFLVLNLLADRFPYKKIPAYGWCQHPSNLMALAMNWEIKPSMMYSYGSSAWFTESFFYVVLVKLVYLLIPFRLICLRIISVGVTLVALVFLYRLAVLLINRPVAGIFLFLLTSSPVYLDQMRSLGYIPLTNAVMVGIAYFLVAGFYQKNSALAVILPALGCFFILSLYAPGLMIIILPILFFIIYLKESWKRLLFFMLFLILFIVITDFFVNGRQFQVAGSITCSEGVALDDHSLPAQLEWRLRHNWNMACHYFSLKNGGFYDQAYNDELQKPDPIINCAYLPFLLLGIIICIWKRQKSNIFILIWFCLTSMPFFITDDIALRRIVFSFNPIFLLTSLGLYGFFIIFIRIRGLNRKRRWLTSISLAFLLIVGGHNIYYYLFQVSRPYYQYSKDQLKIIARTIDKMAWIAPTIRVDRNTARLIWGNPYFDKHFIDISIVKKMERDIRQGKSRKIQNQLMAAVEEGGGMLFIYTMPLGEKPPLRWLNGLFGNRISTFQVPGIKEVYFVHVKKHSNKTI